MAMNKQGQVYLSVKDLKELLDKVEDEDTPVYYQRIDDIYFIRGSWQPKIVRWENLETTQAIKAFGAYEDKDSKCFVIHAHY